MKVVVDVLDMVSQRPEEETKATRDKRKNRDYLDHSTFKMG